MKAAEWELTLPEGNQISFGVGFLPGRKRRAFYVIDESSITGLAYFQDDASAEVAIRLIRAAALARFKED